MPSQIVADYIAEGGTIASLAAAHHLSPGRVILVLRAELGERYQSIANSKKSRRKRQHGHRPPESNVPTYYREDPDFAALAEIRASKRPVIALATDEPEPLDPVQWARYEREITDEPCTTITGSHIGLHKGAQNPRMAYRWSDAILAKHPPALPALPALPAPPAPTIVAKWYKGGAEGLLAAGPWKQKGELFVRRLSPLECARLQSVPDSFVWPEGISKTNAYRIIGNGWSCAHAAHFARAITAVDPEARTVIDLFCGGGLGAVGFHQRFWSYAPAAGSERVA